MLKITIPYKTPSVSHLYYHIRNMKIISNEARKLRDNIYAIVDAIPRPLEVLTVPLKVTIDIYENWYFKNGNIAKKDVINREKFLIDCIFHGLEIDDKFIFINIINKIHSDTEEKAEVMIEVL